MLSWLFIGLIGSSIENMSMKYLYRQFSFFNHPISHSIFNFIHPLIDLQLIVGFLLVDLISISFNHSSVFLFYQFQSSIHLLLIFPTLITFLAHSTTTMWFGSTFTLKSFRFMSLFFHFQSKSNQLKIKLKSNIFPFGITFSTHISSKIRSRTTRTNKSFTFSFLISSNQFNSIQSIRTK